MKTFSIFYEIISLSPNMHTFNIVFNIRPILNRHENGGFENALQTKEFEIAIFEFLDELNKMENRAYRKP